MENKKFTMENTNLTEQELENVSGGAMQAITTNHECTSSGDTPKYHVGQKLTIKYEVRKDNISVVGPWVKTEYYDCECVVIKVNEEKGGLVFKEFTYDVRMTKYPQPIWLRGARNGEVHTGVYESCLYE